MSWWQQVTLTYEGLDQTQSAEKQRWPQPPRRGLSRRHLLRIFAATGATLGLMGAPRQPTLQAQPASAPDLVLKLTPPEHFFDYGTNKEMRWESLYGRGYLTPNGLFFVRNHTRTPRIEASTWRLRVEGTGVARPLELTYDDILALPSLSVIRAIECAGNGRSVFATAYGKKAQGTQWKLGAIGVAEWTGVPLRHVLERVGLKPTAQDVMVEGLDDLKVRRPIPVAKALEADTLLVYAMNGDVLPPDHGFPVRLLTPGWIGVANVKWVGRLEVAEQPLFSHWNTETYVLLGPGYQPAPPANGPILSTQSLKSALELAWEAQMQRGQHLVKGRSWSPFGKIASVEYSLDQGKTWQQARLQEPNIARAWVRWDFPWDALPGSHTIMVKATDEAGNTQPEHTPWNEQGYLYNARISHPVTVV